MTTSLALKRLSVLLSVRVSVWDLLSIAPVLYVVMFISRAIEKGMDVKVIAQFQGHTDGR